MQKVLRKRILRDFRENSVRYLALSSMILLCMYIIISLIGTAETIITGSDKAAERNHLEDGQFTLFVPLTEVEKEELRELGITLEEQFYLDYEVEDESTIRVFQNREKINLIEVVEGRSAEAELEVVLERRYAEEAYEELLVDGKSVKAEEYVYSYLLNDEITNEELKETLSTLKVDVEKIDDALSNLMHFLEVEDNPRAGAAAEDQIINKYGGIIAGGIILVLFAYVISVFVVYGIEKENSVIGALYALGVKRNELILHYLCLPAIITFISGVLGCIIGFRAIGKSTIVGNCYAYFSVPQMETVYPGYLLAYGIVLPPVISIIVNWLVIRKKLNKPALQMLRNEQKSGNMTCIKLGKMGFIAAFRIRQMLREARTSLTVVGGMFISLLILMLGLNCYVMCDYISKDNKTDTKFEYLYTYKYPEQSVLEGGYEAFYKTMKKDNLGYNLDVTILGITEDNPFFDVELTDSKSEVVISSAMAEKYGIRTGEILVLEDEEAEMYHAFLVKDIAQYSTSFYVFMDIDSMRELFNESDTYYNQVFAEKELDIEAGRLYAVTSKKDIEKAADVFIHEMKPMITMMISFSILIFVVVMYLMMKVMIDRSA